ncbi:hypothetical protein A6V36_11940 [Paraburkholderia ginsengiterrae]|uniref:Uncharacterized protein n=1 Tax=Paraburkholderia ginsengiterrae TaxID=1462993 RepID=A0A1A9N2K3_9BURK|nr:hypothetical protein [Paraburkholderia ginsengiterrae]OAJ53071.1 hypothetical protein A6V36_11940 [Paraburkholderia ginsengiterrae]OAJ55769.1 hypothetical protein A6V37_06005 [Paraburkholderia ginsengiterrae]
MSRDVYRWSTSTTIAPQGLYPRTFETDPWGPYCGFAPSAGGVRIILSLVGLSGFFTGMLSGLVALAAPEAAAGGGLIIGVSGCGALACACAITAETVEMANTKTVLVHTSA